MTEPSSRAASTWLVRDAGDALAVHRLERHGGVEREAGEDRGLLRGVVAADVGGRVGLGVAELGRGGERVVERLAVARPCGRG